MEMMATDLVELALQPVEPSRGSGLHGRRSSVGHHRRRRGRRRRHRRWRREGPVQTRRRDLPGTGATRAVAAVVALDHRLMMTVLVLECGVPVVVGGGVA